MDSHGEPTPSRSAAAAESRFQSCVRYSPVVVVFVAMAIGATARSAPVRPEAWFALGVFGWWSFLAARYLVQPRATSVAILFVVACWTAAYASDDWSWRRGDNLGFRIAPSGQPVAVKVVVESVPPDRLSTRGVFVQAKAVRDGSDWAAATGRGQLLLRDPQAAFAFERGQVLRIWGRVYRPSSPANPGEFDARRRSRERNIDFSLAVERAEQILLLEYAPLSSADHLRCGLAWIRRRAFAALEENLSPPQADVALALVLGERGRVSRMTRERFIRGGVMHLLAISGLHVGMVLALFWQALRLGLVARRWQLPATLFAAVAFAVFSGGQPPVLRATLFVAFMVLGRSWDRQADVLSVLCGAGAALLLLDPSHLFETGVHMSFLAVAVLGRFADRMGAARPEDPWRRLVFNSRPRWEQTLRGAAGRLLAGLGVSTLVCLLLTPISATCFHVLTPLAPLLNLLLTPCAALALVSGLAVVLLEFAIGGGWLAAPLCELSLSMMMSLMAWGESWQPATIWTCGPPRWWLVCFYFSFLITGFGPPRGGGRLTVGVSLAWLLILGGGVFAPQDRRLRCTVLAVGHGACVLIQTPEGKNLLYDAGSLGRAEFAGRQIAATLWSERIQSLDAVVVSHADEDHFNCLPHLGRRFLIREVVATRAFHQHPSARRVVRELERRGAAMRIVSDGDELKVGSSTCFHLWHPQSSTATSNNAQSLVLSIEHSGRRLLLTGDLEREGMTALLARPPLVADVALAPHHGSAHSDPAAFADWAQPRWVVASTGRGRSLEPLRRACRRVGATMLSTDRSGAIRFVLDGEELRVSSWRRGRWRSIDEAVFRDSHLRKTAPAAAGRQAPCPDPIPARE